MTEPKFKIGQFVYRRQDLAAYNFDNAKGYDPKPHAAMILGIHHDICYAGVQIHYILRGYTTNGSILEKIIEIELTDKFEKQV